VPALVDTNVLVYRYDGRFPEKQRAATALLRRGISEGSLRVPHQALVEFVAAVTRVPRGGTPLLAADEALREAEDMLEVFDVLYPTADLVRLALRGMSAYRLPWFEAHLWAYAEYFSLDVLYSEDFQHDRHYGKVRAVNPFI
jgi:predicted nucleic acid-binding protein